MIARVTVKAWIADSLRAGGLRGRGRVWRLKGQEVQWVVRIDEPPRHNHLAVDVGLDLQSVTTPSSPNYCPIYLALEHMPFAGDSAIVEAMDFDSRVLPKWRKREIEDVTGALTSYMAERMTLSAVRAAYRNGEFKAGFIHKDVRGVLASHEGT